jgi:hypothetical protein
MTHPESEVVDHGPFGQMFYPVRRAGAAERPGMSGP